MNTTKDANNNCRVSDFEEFKAELDVEAGSGHRNDGGARERGWRRHGVLN